jgi:hypothetical protein
MVISHEELVRLRNSRGLWRKLFDLTLMLTILLVAGCFSPQQGESSAEREKKEKIAKAQASIITDALVKFNMDRGNYPSSLKELTQKGPNGEKAILEPHDLVGPWGEKFQVDFAGAHHDGNKPDVWTESPDGKKIGNWTVQEGD